MKIFASNVLFHLLESHKENELKSPGNIEEIWIGQKLVIYNVKGSGKNGENVKMELYYDRVGKENFEKPPNDWIQYFTYTDDGQGSRGLGLTSPLPGGCNAISRNEIFTWGGPEVTLRIDEIESVDVKWLSVREIDPSRPVKNPIV